MRGMLYLSQPACQDAQNAETPMIAMVWRNLPNQGDDAQETQIVTNATRIARNPLPRIPLHQVTNYGAQ